MPSPTSVFSEHLEQLSSDEDVRALEEVRESIQRTLAEAGVNREIAGTGLDEKLEAIRLRNAETKAQVELAELKRTRREVLVRMNVPTAVSVNGDLKPAS